MSAAAAGAECQLRIRHLHSSRHCLGVHCGGHRKTLEYVWSRASRNIQKLLVRPDDGLVAVHLEDNLGVVEVWGGDIGREFLSVCWLHITDGGLAGLRGVPGGVGVGGGGRGNLRTGISSPSPQCQQDHDCKADWGENANHDRDDGGNTNIGPPDRPGVGKILHDFCLNDARIEGLRKEISILDDLVSFIDFRGGGRDDLIADFILLWRAGQVENYPLPFRDRI